MNQKREESKFGDFFYEHRIKLGYTLRQFCKNKGYDPAYISRVENNFLQPPDDPDKLKALAIALEFKPDTTDWVNFFDLASASKYQIPEDIKKQNPEIIKLLPAFFRTIRKQKVTKEDVDKLLQLLILSKEDVDGTPQTNNEKG